MRCRPIFIPETQTYTGISTYVDAAGTTGAVVRLGIYDTDSSGKPVNLVLDAGTISSTTTGVKTITISQSLTAGKYFLTAVSQTAQCNLLAEIGVHTYAHTSFPFWHANIWELSGITGALPATWTTYGTLRSTSFRVLLRR